MVKVIVGVAVLLSVVGCSPKRSNPVAVSGPEYGSATIVADLPPRLGLAKSAVTVRSAEVVVSGTDMNSVTQPLTVTSTTIRGNISNVPIGLRTFRVNLYDSVAALQYYGSSVTTVTANQVSAVSIPLSVATPQTGSVQVNVTYPSDSIKAGYQYYNITFTYVSLSAMQKAGLTEMHFTGTNVPDSSKYNPVYWDVVLSDLNIPKLFNNNETESSYTRPTANAATLKWSIKVNMGMAYTFTGLYFVYPLTSVMAGMNGWASGVTVEASTSTQGPWVNVGSQEFTATHTKATVPLVY